MNIERREGGPITRISDKNLHSPTALLNHYKQDFKNQFYDLFNKYIKYRNEYAWIVLSEGGRDISNQVDYEGQFKSYYHRSYALEVLVKNDYYHAHAKCNELVVKFLTELKNIHMSTGEAPICLRWEPTFNWENLEMNEQSENPKLTYKVTVKVRLSFIHPYDEILRIEDQED
jgi:hypothetical protein